MSTVPRHLTPAGQSAIEADAVHTLSLTCAGRKQLVGQRTHNKL